MELGTKSLSAATLTLLFFFYMYFFSWNREIFDALEMAFRITRTQPLGVIKDRWHCWGLTSGGRNYSKILLNLVNSGKLI
jgi:hypothetical protein